VLARENLDGSHVWDKLGLSGYLACLVHLVSLIQPNKPFRPNRPNEQDRLADFFNSLLNGFLDFAAAETSCADPNAFGLTVDQCTDWLEVGLEDPLGLVIGVADVIA
jgi:hypothetical protein